MFLLIKEMKMISFRRLYHLSCVTYNFTKQGIKLCKMVNPERKRQWYQSQKLEASALPTVKSLTKIKHEPGKRGQRRMAMLNKMFMKQITDLMSTGTVSMDLVGRAIEISKVSVTPDLHTINVFWVCKGDASDDETEKVLNKVAGALRHELSTLRIMGEIPFITFVKDKQESYLVDLQRRLAVADYGVDYTPTDMGNLLKSDFILNTKLSSEVKAEIQKLEDELHIVEEPVPEMTHDVFGLDHSKMMSRLLAARKKTRDAWRTLENRDENLISYRVAPYAVPDPAVINQRKELADFLLKRQIMQKKMQKKRLEDSRQVWQMAEETTEEHSEEQSEEDDEYYEDDDEESFTYYTAHTDLSDSDKQAHL